MAHGVPIVTPAFFDEYIKDAREHKQLLPNVEDFVPETTEPYIIKDDPTMMAVHLDRQRLFQKKTFVFMVTRNMEQFQHVIPLAAGKCVAMDTNKVKKTFLCKPECIPVQYTPSENTQSSANVEAIVEYIHKNGRRLINESEISLAILHRSIDRFCNPDRKLTTDFQPNSASAIDTADLLKGALISATPLQDYKDQPASNPDPNPNSIIPESADLSGTEPNNNLNNAEADESNKPSPRKSSRLSSKNVSTDLPDQLMPPPPPPRKQKQQQQPQPSTSKRKHAEQTSPSKSAGSEPMEQEQTSGPAKKQKTNNNSTSNDSGENSSGSAPIVDPIPPASSGSQQSDLNFSGFISTQNRRNRMQAAAAGATSQTSQPSRVLVHAKDSRKRAVDLLNDDSDDEQNEDEDNEKTFNFNRKSKRAKITSSKPGSQAKRRAGGGILDDNDDDDEDDGDGFSFNFSRKRNSERTSQAKRRKNTENESNQDDGDVCVVDAAGTQPTQNTYKKPFKHALNRSSNRTMKPIEFVPAPACQTDWITRKMKNELNLNEKPQQSSSSVKIKEEKLEEWEMTDEEKKRQWIKSMANVFSIRKIDVDLSRSRYAADETDNSAHDVLNNTKNFKKFVKVKYYLVAFGKLGGFKGFINFLLFDFILQKNNYIPRTTVIKTHPVPVLISAFARI